MNQAASPNPDRTATGLWSLLRSLGHRNFRLYFFGQTVSLIGTWMQQVALNWLVYGLTDSAYWLGVSSFASQMPTFFLSPLAGVLADRWDRRQLLLITQFLSMVQALALAFLALSGEIALWHVLVLAGFLGLVNAFDMVGRQAFLTEMLEDRADLGNAIAMNSFTFNSARLVGPSVAGVLLALVGAGICFLLNGLSYLAVLAALYAMRLQPRGPEPARVPLRRGLREGFAYAFGFAPIRSLLLLVSLVSLVGASYVVLLPVFATAPELLHGGAQTYGLLLSAAGCGALAGAVYLAARKSVLGLGIRIALSPSVLGLSLLAVSFVRTLWLALLLLLLMGMAMMVQMAASNTLIQTIVEDDKRGRVMSFYTMAFFGMAPIGSLLAGWLADALGVPATLRIGGGCCVAGSLLFAWQLPRFRAGVRPHYVRLGIVPGEPVASSEAAALGAATMSEKELSHD